MTDETPITEPADDVEAHRLRCPSDDPEGHRAEGADNVERLRRSPSDHPEARRKNEGDADVEAHMRRSPCRTTPSPAAGRADRRRGAPAALPVGRPEAPRKSEGDADVEAHMRARSPSDDPEARRENRGRRRRRGALAALSVG